MSEKRYPEKCSVTTFEATVEAAGPEGVALDRTCFYRPAAGSGEERVRSSSGTRRSGPIGQDS